jgi:hypothetical protein
MRSLPTQSSSRGLTPQSAGLATYRKPRPNVAGFCLEPTISGKSASTGRTHARFPRIAGIRVDVAGDRDASEAGFIDAVLRVAGREGGPSRAQPLRGPESSREVAHLCQGGSRPDVSYPLVVPMITSPPPSTATHCPVGVHDTAVREPSSCAKLSIFVAVQESGSVGSPTNAKPP